MKVFIATAALLLAVPTFAPAQGEDHQYRGQGYFFFGLGTGTVYYGESRNVIEHVGFGGEGFLHKGLGVGAEAGYAHWGPYSNQAWIASGDASYHFRRNTPRGGVDPFVLIGVTGYFPTSEGRGAPAGNFGGGINVWLRERAALRLEVRDHVNIDSHSNGYPGTHYVSFRVGMTFR
jgi:hypothetical protein